MKLKLYLCDGIFAGPFDLEDQKILVQSEKELTSRQAEELVANSFYAGTFYIEEFKEVTEKEIRNIKTILVKG